MFGRGLGDTYVVFLLPLEREFGWSRSQLTSVYSIYLLVHGFTSPLVGMLFDRLGPRWVYATGMACVGAAFLLAGELVSLWQFYLFIGALVPRKALERDRHRVLRGRGRHNRVRAACAVPGGALRLAVRLSFPGGSH